MLTKEAYLADPCGTSSLPYWKALTVRPPAGVRVLHARELPEEPSEAGTALRYFRLICRPDETEPPELPAGFVPGPLTPEEAAAHISICYSDVSASAAELAAYRQHPVFDGTLWLAVRDRASGEIAASGIGELDRDLREGVLEWIQVSPAFRRRGLGAFTVRELLRRMRGRVDFVTVSGKADDPCRPELLYRSCGFTGRDLWYVLPEPAVRILPVTEAELDAAAAVHAAGWRASHAEICAPDFVAAHTARRQRAYLARKLEAGSRLFLLTDGEPCGVAAVTGSLIEDLYVLPEKQGRGYGTALLRRAIRECGGTPTLWLLETNHRAARLYARMGFRPTGRVDRSHGPLAEIEFALDAGIARDWESRGGHS